MTSEQRLADLREDVWRALTCRISWAYRRGDAGLPPREAWDELCSRVKRLRRVLKRKNVTATLEIKTETRRKYMRDYMKLYRSGARSAPNTLP